MKKVTIVILITLMIIFIFVAFIGTYSESYQKNRFIKIEDCGSFNLYYDNKTKVQYIISDDVYNRGTATLLVDEEGQPLLYNE